MDELSQVLAVAAVFVAAGIVKGVTGMGLPTVAVSLLGLWMAPAQAAALLVLPSLATNIAQCRGPALRRLATALWPAWLGLLAVTLLWPAALPGLDAAAARRLLGGVLVGYGAWGLWRPALPALPLRAGGAALAAGVLTGVLTATTAVFVLPLVPYLQALRLDKATMVQALGLSFTVATLALALRLQAVGGGASPAALWPWALWALAAACAGLAFGTLLRGRLSPTAFQRALFVVFIGLGATNLVHR